MDSEDKLTLVDLYGDSFANYASTKFARMMAEKSKKPVYEYRFHHIGSFTITDFFNMASILGLTLIWPLIIPLNITLNCNNNRTPPTPQCFGLHLTVTSRSGTCQA